MSRRRIRVDPGLDFEGVHRITAKTGWRGLRDKSTRRSAHLVICRPWRIWRNITCFEVCWQKLHGLGESRHLTLHSLSRHVPPGGHAMPLDTIALFYALATGASTAPAPPPNRPAIDCTDQAHRAIEFWIGDWNVTDTASSKPIADSRIEWVVGGCGVRETYAQSVGPDGKPTDYRGTSYTALDNRDHTWRQFYVDNTGSATNYDGNIEGRQLVLNTHAGNVANRMTIQAQADGSVRQSGEVSLDDGKTWAPGYDFTYRRKP
jgi:hypothetical protein